MLIYGVSAALAKDVGMACFVKGKPEVSASAKRWEPLRLFRRLQTGNKIRCDSASEAIVVVFGRGERFRVAAGHTADVADDKVNGAVSLGELKGPSESAARLLAGSGVGARTARATQLAGRMVMLSRPYDAYPGWLEDGNRRIAWNEVKGAVTYRFALYDTDDVLLWSIPTSEHEAMIPDNVQLAFKRPYIWRLNAFTADGSSVMVDGMPDYRWGVLTVLTDSDAKELLDVEQKSNVQIQAHPTDGLLRLLLAEQFRQCGVLTRAWETIESACEAKAITEAERSQALIEILSEISGAVRVSGQLKADEKN